MTGKRVVDGILGAGALVGAFFFPPAAAAFAGVLKTTGTSLLLQSLVGPGRRTNLAGRQEGIETNVSSPQRALPVVYGTARVGLAPVDVRTTGTNNAELYLVGALAVGSRDGSGIEAIRQIYFDDRVAFDANGAKVPPYMAATMSVEKYLGTDAQTVSPAMNAAFPSAWPASSRGRGIAYIVVRITYDGQLFPAIPTITADVRGCRLWDMRTSTWTAPGDDANPALAIYDYLVSPRYGLGLDPAELDGGPTGSFAEMANYYDELVEGTASAGPRHRCRGWLDTGATIGENLTQLLSSCRGQLLYDNGIIRLLTRRPTVAVSFALTQDTIVGDWTFTTAGVSAAPTAMEASFPDPDRRDRPQTVRWPREGRFAVQNAFLVAPALVRLQLSGDLLVGGWEHGLATGDVIEVTGVTGLTGANGTWTVTRVDATTVELQGSSGSGTWTGGGFARGINPYTAADAGYESVQRIDLPMTANRLRAEQIINVQVRELRAGLTAEVTALQSALQLRVGDVVNVTHPTPGWVNKPMWVMAMTLLPDDTVRLVLNEYDASAYSLSPRATAPAATPTVLPNPLVCQPASGLALANGVQRADQSVAQLLATWTASPDPFLDKYVVQARRASSAGSWDDFGETPRGVEQFVITPLTPNEAWEVRVFAVNAIGVYSAAITASRTPVLNPASITLGTAVVTDRYVEIPYTIPADSTATLVEVWYREDAAQPAVGSIARGFGAQPAGTPLLNPSGGTSGTIRLPSSPSTWVTVLVVPIDTLNRPNLTIPVRQHQTLATPATPPAAPTATTFQSATTTTVTMGVTLPGSIPSGAVIRTYRNGAVFGSDQPITVGGGATQAIVYSGLSPGTSYSWQHTLVNASGESARTTATAGNTIVGTLPTPTVLVTESRLEEFVEYYFASASGTGMPPGVTWEYQVDEGSGYVTRAATVSSTVELSSNRQVTTFTAFVRVRAVLAGWTTSAYSDPVGISINLLGGGNDA